MAFDVNGPSRIHVDMDKYEDSYERIFGWQCDSCGLKGNKGSCCAECGNKKE